MPGCRAYSFFWIFHFNVFLLMKKVFSVFLSPGLMRAFLALAILFSVWGKAFAADYFWVGGSGNWNDLNHWATTSGGTGHPAIIPTGLDDVYFDAGSGFSSGTPTVTMNVAGSCRSMFWSGGWVANPIFNGSSALSVYGSLLLSPAMTYSFTGSITFEASTPGWTITMGNRQVSNSIIFSILIFLFTGESPTTYSACRCHLNTEISTQLFCVIKLILMAFLNRFTPHKICFSVFIYFI